MSINIGIIGLSRSGKTTVFNALTRGKDDADGVTHFGMVKVPDRRLQALAEMLHPHKLVPTELRYIDIGASGHSPKVKGIGGQLLAELSDTDALINVVRAFPDDSVPHEAGSLDIERDISAMNLELAFSDLAIVERHVKKIEESLKAAKPAERQAFAHEQQIMQKLKEHLEKEIPIREISLTAEEQKNITGFKFLTAKPLLIVINVGENQLSQAKETEEKLNIHYSRLHCRVITLCGKLEIELNQLDAEAAAAFRADFGIFEPGLDRVIKSSYELLRLVIFFTIASGEVRAWPITTATEAVKAAGKIHSDMERGFIRAEVIGFDDLVKCGSIAEARKRGLLRLEGKTYVVRDGDVITFLFNI